MEYSIIKLAGMAGVSKRTFRYNNVENIIAAVSGNFLLRSFHHPKGQSPFFVSTARLRCHCITGSHKVASLCRHPMLVLAIPLYVAANGICDRPGDRHS